MSRFRMSALCALCVLLSPATLVAQSAPGNCLVVDGASLYSGMLEPGTSFSANPSLLAPCTALGGSAFSGSVPATERVIFPFDRLGFSMWIGAGTTFSLRFFIDGRLRHATQEIRTGDTPWSFFTWNVKYDEIE